MIERHSKVFSLPHIRFSVVQVFPIKTGNIEIKTIVSHNFIIEGDDGIYLDASPKSNSSMLSGNY